MSYTASHRRRRGSSHLQDACPPSPMQPSPDSKNKGVWANLKLKLKRGKSGNYSDRSGGDTLLPTTFQMHSPLAGRNRKTMHNSATAKPMTVSATSLCNGMNNSFLMGGVDKRRYRRKPKGLLYRIFWSSLYRRLGVSFFLLYLAVYHVLVPLGTWVIQEALWDGSMGSSMTNGINPGVPSDSNILQALVHGPRFDTLVTVKQERKYLHELVMEREAVDEHGYKNLESRWKILEQIAPEWYHRFDADIVYKKNAIQKNKHDHQEVSKHEKENNDDQADVDDRVNVVEEVDKISPKEKEATESTEATKPTAQTTMTKKRYHQPVDKSQSPETARHLLVKGGIYIPDEQVDSNDNDSNLLPLRTLQNYESLGSQYSSCDNNAQTATTLVTQTSIDRLWIVHETCSNRWTKDPIIAVVFAPSSTEEDSTQEETNLQSRLENQSLELLEDCPNLTLVRYEADHIESLQGRYPVNRLRNVGLDLVRTSHVIMVDVDLVPSRDLSQLVEQAISNQNTTQKALVVPAFEKKAPGSCEDAQDAADCMSQYLQSDSAFLPQDFDELSDCVQNEECVVFQSQFNWDGHSTTRSDRWLQKDWYEDEDDATTKQFKRIPCFHTARYEPYVVVEWCPVNANNDDNKQQLPLSPYYDERFYGYGKNKIEMVSHLRRSNVKFEILPQGFLVHNPHPESRTKETWLNKDQSNDLHATMDSLYKSFLQELDTEYKTVHKDSTKLCERP